jgi:long-chain acyl-CoA synthetase
VSNIADALFAQARTRGEAIALHFEGSAYTFAAFAGEVRRLAAGLAALGFRPGHKLGLMLSNRPEFLFLEYAAFALGGVVVPLNIHYKRGEIEHVIGTCEVEFMVVEAAGAERIASDIRARCPALRHVVVLDAGVPGGDGLLQSDAVLRGTAGTIELPVERDAQDLALMLHTSATTGKAKGVMLSIANLRANYDRTPEWLGLDASDVILCALPLYNTFALNQCINATVFTGASMVLLRRFEAAACLAAVERHRCTFFPSVPTMLQKMLYHPDAHRHDVSSLRRLCVGAAPVPAPLLAAVHQRIGEGTEVITGYGLTEGTALVSMHRVTLDAAGVLQRPKSVGRSLPGIEVVILDDEGGEVPRGAVGEICVKGPNVMQGYYHMPEETARAIVDGWLHTGDLGCMEPDGHFAIVDRKKDLIIRGGQNIYPADIEEVLYHHPAVAEAAVIGVEDEVLGEVPRAFVALKPAAHATTESLLELCRAELAYFKVPVSIEILPELPKGPTGKILRRALRTAGSLHGETRLESERRISS